jgi:hypothetical protein
MVPRLGGKYGVEVETISKPFEEYRTEKYAKSGLPVAPAVMIGEEMVVQGCDADEGELEAAICRHLGLPEPERSKKGIFSKLLGG